ncbi:MAG: GNAT family N-acetyltransferase [Clostridia bacterium]|nr:GNAT family N-acetyltransferase [Clostridia bacterium]
MDGLKRIRLEKLTWDTVNSICKLKVNKDQKEFVASNSDSIIDAYFATIEEGMKVYPFGIYYGKKPIGFVMLTYNCPWATKYYDLPKNYYYIWRFMIDKKYQGQGFGKQALKLVLDFIKTFPCGESEACWLSYEPENEVARKLYLSFGFIEALDHYKEGQEIPAILIL